MILRKNNSENLIEIYGKSIDLSNFNLLKILEKESAKSKNKALIVIDEVKMQNEVYLDNLKINIECAQDQCIKGYLNAEIAKDFKLQSIYREGVVKITSNNAGLLLQALGISNTIKNGNLFFYINLQDEYSYDGEVFIENFRLTKAPIIAQILSIASFDGLISTLNGNGIHFKRLFIPFNYKNAVVFTRGSLAEGTSLGIKTTGTINFKKNFTNLKGTVIPFYAINHNIEKIPIIGRLITAGEEKGFFFGIDYSLIGDINNPLIGANPLTAFAPGFLRKMFRISQ